MKLLILAFTFLASQSYAAHLCEVYGISDSPQSLTCIFKGEKMNVSCRNGSYYVGNEIVEGAYHMEVEEGPTPLVFRTKTGELTVTLTSGRNHEAVLTENSKKITGSCRL